MQQEPSTATTGSNRNLIFGLAAAGIAIAGVAGLALWFGGQTKIKRKKPAKKAATKSGAAPSGKGESGKNPLVRADDAKITLEKASKMSIDEIQAALEKAESEGDKASQINILFLLASSLLQQEQLQKQHIEAAVQYYNIALQFASEINSEMLGPILLELAVLAFQFKNLPQAMALFEQGLKQFLETPEEEVEISSTKHILSLFVMLTECYLSTKQHQRGIDFLLEYIKSTENRKELAELVPPLMLSVGEFSYALKDYTGCVSYLEQGLAKAQGSELPPDMAMLYNYYLAWGNVKAENNEQAIKYLEKYLEAAKAADAPVESTLESIMSLVICYKESNQPDLAIKTVERARQALQQIDQSEHPLLCLKQFYFLGLYCLNKLGEIECARELLEQAYHLAKSNPALSKDMPWGTIAIDLAEAYHKLKLREKALETIEVGLTALRERDTSLIPSALIRKAKICSEMSDKASAVAALEEALGVAEQLKSAKDETDSNWLRRFLKFQLGKIYTLMGQLSKAHTLLTEAFTAFVGTTDAEIRTVVLATIASNLAQAGEREAALKKMQEVLDVMSSSAQKLSEGDIRTELGECHLFLGDYLKAKQDLESALEHFRKEKSEKSELLVLVRLAAIHDWLGQLDLALEHLALAEKAKDKDSSVVNTGSVGAGFALHYLLTGEIAKAQAAADKVASCVDPACCGGTPLNVLSYNGLLAETNFWSDRMESAIEYFQRCTTLISTAPFAKENIASILNVQTRLVALSLHMESKGQDANALSMLGQLLPLARTKGSPLHVALLLALTGLANARSLEHGETEAEALFTEALSVAEETADRRVLALVNRLAGSFYSRYAIGKADEGKKHLHMALELARELGDQLLESLALRDLAILAVQEATEEDKERTWKEATAGALEIAERTGNRYLANLLSHLPGQASQEQTLVAATETSPEDSTPAEAHSTDASEESKPEEAVTEEAVSEEAKLDEAQTEETKDKDAAVAEETKAEETEVQITEPETKPEEAEETSKPEEVEEVKFEEVVTEETKTEEASDKPADEDKVTIEDVTNEEQNE